MRSVEAAVCLALGLVAALAPTARAADAKFPYATGALFSDEADVAAVPPARLTRGFVVIDSIDLSPRMPPPGDQGKNGTCAAWASVYGAGSFYARAALKDPNVTLSPAYVFNQVDHGTSSKLCEGSAVKQNLDFLARKGSTAFDSFPDQDFCKPAATTPISAAPIYRIPGYRQLAYSRVRDDMIEMTRPLDLDLARQTLSEGNPIIIGFNLTDEGLAALKADDVYRSAAEYDNKRSLGGHAMLIVGFDNGRHAFKIMNSWGPRWADQGYGWIDYETMRTHAREAYSVSADAEPPAPTTPTAVNASRGECAAVQFEKKDDAYVLEGFVERDADRGRYEKEAEASLEKSGLKGQVGLRDDLAVFPWPQCESVLVLADELNAKSRPSLDTLDGRKEIKIGEPFGFELKSPPSPSYLYLIYLQADGAAINLLPRQGAARAPIPPNTRIRLGDASSKGPKFMASDPPGGEAAIAIAANRPIPELEALEQAGGQYYRLGASEKAGDADVGVRRVLSAINDGLRAQGADLTVSADVVLLTIER